MVRLGDERRDQLIETGHHHRLDDIDRIIELGVTAVRFPVLWERVAPDSQEQLDFAWSDARLERLRAAGVRVIAGLVHHGAGPDYTSLVDPDFPAKLGTYAARVAAQYPWIEDWTPVNEPLTTARFSGLYGHWHPHGRDQATFLRCLANECLGTLAAMQAIRAINPAARLVQADDLGKTFATAPLGYQAEHDNERRWLSFDLLCGRVDEANPWHGALLRAGISPDELARLKSGAARPDLIGVNHYLTSDRFLDHRTDLYPAALRGGNGRDAYADAEAVRVAHLNGEVGLAARLREAWERYRIPLAVTEVHHGCHREEQLRWLAQCWRDCETVRAEGVDLRALTLWGMFGSVDWRSLLTERRGCHDPGVYDVRGEQPRPTALATAARALATEGTLDHPALDQPGWWRRPPRLYAWCEAQTEEPCIARQLLITGATGTLGQAFARICAERALPLVLTARSDLDICNPQSVAAALDRHRPWAVVNTAGFVRVADAEAERDACFAWNADGAAELARQCAAAAIPLVTFSSDLVFDGRLGRAYREGDEVSPQGAYGESKATAEARVLAAHRQALVVRTAAFFGPWDRYNFAWDVLQALASGERFPARADLHVSPTYVPDLVHVALDLIVDGARGLWHVAGPERLSWYDFAVRLAEAAGLDPALVDPIEEPGGARDTSLVSRHGALLRPTAEAIAEFAALIAGGRQEQAETMVATLPV